MSIQLTQAQIKLLTVHIVRDIDTLRAVVDRVERKMWDRSETFEMACWEVASSGFRESGGIMPREIFEVQLRACLDREHPNHGMTPENVDTAIESLFVWPENALSFSLIRPILEEFLVARLAAVNMSALMMGTADYSSTIRELSQILNSAQLSSAKPEDLNTGDEIFASMERWDTGCQPFDVITGGIYAGQTIGLLGPMKGGKTSLMQSITSECIRKGIRVTYMTYEESVPRLLPKLIISFMNRHHRNTVEGKRNEDIDPAIRADIAAARLMIANNVSLMDMSGAREGQGLGGAHEMATCIENLHRNGTLGQLVIVDHVLPMVRAYANATGKDLASMMRHMVADVCNQFKSVCERVNVTGILAHQMAAKANEGKKHVPTHMDAAECRLFAEVLHDTICLGKRNNKNIAMLNLSATRTTEPKQIWVEVAGHKCRVQMPAYRIVTDKDGCPMSEDDAEYGRLGVDDRGNPYRRPKAFQVGHEMPDSGALGHEVDD